MRGVICCGRTKGRPYDAFASSYNKTINIQTIVDTVGVPLAVPENVDEGTLNVRKTRKVPEGPKKEEVTPWN